MNWRLFFVVIFTSFLFLALMLLLGSMHLLSLFLRKVTAPTPPTIALLLSLRLLLRFSKLCLTPTSSNISNLTIFFQITSMASKRQDLQGIFFPILLMPGHSVAECGELKSAKQAFKICNFDPKSARFSFPLNSLRTIIITYLSDCCYTPGTTISRETID